MNKPLKIIYYCQYILQQAPQAAEPPLFSSHRHIFLSLLLVTKDPLINWTKSVI